MKTRQQEIAKVISEIESSLDKLKDFNSFKDLPKVEEVSSAEYTSAESSAEYSSAESSAEPKPKVFFSPGLTKSWPRFKYLSGEINGNLTKTRTMALDDSPLASGKYPPCMLPYQGLTA